ncbi:sensor histidine kinase [Lederbergia wuyishanensis]|uniref:histidine kinase n=1 Tax=Lederbergia wuyishanensis TaxID=1347903 RepID=A0ABU0D2P1_9BACI|nr:histidine kinase [Lederbergia wuyishanensis]MCJ8007173.1 histidine kinase [Lederbergia wuyishanensis]MDQ0342682.1 sensor histidine kinase YesM [Lederbergia wuyishanensis]
MNSIQKKILVLVIAVLFIMAAIWISLTYYNQKMQNQYNDILERYLIMNEVTSESQQMVAALNNYLIEPTEVNLKVLNISKTKIEKTKDKVSKFRNSDNDFALTNYENLIDSLVETTSQSVLNRTGQQTEDYLSAFSEASRISKYISEMTLTLIDTELKTYDLFYRNMIDRSEELRILGMWLLLLITLFLLISTHWFSKRITRPVNKLTEAAHELSMGRFDLKIEVDSNDEISFLAKTFDKMRININNYLSEIKQKAQLENELQQSKLLLQESQLRSLQSQINPHFLYNTLDILSKKAYLEGSEETSDLLVSVAGLLRYNLNNLEDSATLFEEVHVLKQYIDIQKARFIDRLQFNMDIDDSCLGIEIPRLTLQPIVENAVIYAIEPEEDGGSITFRAKDEGDWVRIELEDSGPGMTEEKVKQILRVNVKETKGHFTGIGISNVVKRLSLFYDSNDVFDIESKQGSGTKVILKIPKTRGEKGNETTPNRG